MLNYTKFILVAVLTATITLFTLALAISASDLL